MLAHAQALRQTSRRLVARALELRREADSLQLSSTRVSESSTSLFTELRQNVEEYAVTLRTLGETPEHTVIQVKQIAVEAGRDAEAQAPSRRFDHDGVREEIVRWATQAYFAS